MNVSGHKPRRVLVTPRSVTRDGHPSLKRLEQSGFEVVFCTPGNQPTADELKRLLPGCVGWLAGVEEISDAVLAAASDLRVISRNGVGVDNIDLASAQRRGIAVKKAIGSNARGVAELAMAHLLALARWVTFSDRAIKGGGWERRKGFELADKTLGLLGCGNVGRMVAKLALAFDMKAIAYDVMPDRTFNPSPDFRYATFDEVLTTADVLSVHCSALPMRRALIDASALARMKRGAFLINTARADLIDDAALAAALTSGQLAGAAVDVFKTEPPGDDPLSKHHRVVATPHIGGFTDRSVDRAMNLAVKNLLQELK